MSFNVYTGIKFKTKSYEKVIMSLKSIRKQALKNMANSLMDSGNFIGLASKMSENLKEDLIKYKKDPTGINLALVKYEIIRDLDSRNDDECRLNCDLDYCFKVMIYPYKGSLYGNYFGANSCGKNVNLLMTVADDYWYGDQGDPDTNVTEKEWNQRREVWNGIFDEYWSAAENGACFYIAKWGWIDYNDIPNELVEKLANLPMFDENRN